MIHIIYASVGSLRKLWILYNNVLLLHTLYLHPIYLLLSCTIIFNTLSTNCNLLLNRNKHMQMPTSSTVEWWICLYAIKRSCWWERGLENSGAWRSKGKRPLTSPSAVWVLLININRSWADSPGFWREGGTTFCLVIYKTHLQFI